MNSHGERGAERLFLQFGRDRILPVNLSTAACFFGGGAFKMIANARPCGIRWIDYIIGKFTGFVPPPCVLAKGQELFRE